MYGSLLIPANMHTIDAVVKNQPASAGERRDSGSVTGLGRYSRVGNGNQSSVLIWKISWIENPDGLQSMGLQRVRDDWATEHMYSMHMISFIGIQRIVRSLWARPVRGKALEELPLGSTWRICIILYMKNSGEEVALDIKYNVTK